MELEIKILNWREKYDEGLCPDSNPFLFNNLDIEVKYNWLEIGAGLGKLSYTAKSKGFSTTVTEVDKDAISFLKEEMGFNCVLLGEIQELFPQLIKNESYDIVVLHHVLEHVTNLQETLSSVFQLLKPGGLLYIAVPNLDNFGYRLYRAFCYLTMKIPEIVDGIEHTYGFTPKTLSFA